MRKLIICCIFLIQSVYANLDLPVIAVGDAKIEKDSIVFNQFGGRGNGGLTRLFVQLLKNDFGFYKQSFKVVKSNGEDSNFGSVNYTNWKNKNIPYIGHVNITGKSALRYDFKLFDSRKKELVFSTQGTFDRSSYRRTGHELTNLIYKEVTGKESIFQSKVIFVSDKGSTKRKRFKELYVMDFDGKNKKQLTYHRGTVISPAFSSNGSKVLYSLIKEGRKKRNINLHLLNLKTGKSEMLSKRPGINSGAVFLPGDQSIALTLSHQGNAEIYKMDLATRKLERLTKHYSPDVDPSVNLTGDKMTFLSGRPGKPMIYVSDPRGMEKDVKRVGFVGKFNATPRFSPDGKEIAFSSWMDNRFDIFRISASGEHLYRLTKDFGSNEDPTYSNDGQFIAFSSQRVLSRTRAVQNIYIMTREGEVIGQVTEGFGNCITPRWSKL